MDVELEAEATPGNDKVEEESPGTSGVDMERNNDDEKGEPSSPAKDDEDTNNNVGEMVTCPVLLPSVLELVFEDLSLIDLQTCRQVSKLWYKEATRTLGLRLKVDLNDQESVEKVLVKLKQQPSLRIAELNACNIDLNAAEFQELFLKTNPTLSIFRVTDGNISLGNWMKMLRASPNLLRLEIGALKDGDSHLKLFPIHTTLPHHGEMRFEYLQYLEFLSYGTPSSIFLSDVVRACPTLKKLIAYNFPEENPSHFEGLSLPNLDVFYVPQLSGLCDTHVQGLLKLNLKLSELMFNNFDSDLSPTLIRKFIESQSETLKHLLLTQSKNDQEPFVEQTPSCPFPLKLPNLTYLEVEKPFVRNMCHVINVESFPELSHLYLRFHPGSNWIRCLPKNLKTHPGVHHLTIQWIEEKPLIQMSKGFPNLKALDIMYCDDNLLRVIYTNLPQLEMLNVEDSEYRKITDEGLTGLTDDAPDDAVRKLPFVGNLKNLNLLSLEFKFHPVTERAILKGIVEATSLKVLRISGMQISSEVANIVLEKLVNLTTHCMQVDECHLHECCIKNIMDQIGNKEAEPEASESGEEAA